MRRTNHTLVDTSFKLISDFFHVSQGVLCCEHAEQASSSGVFEGGGGVVSRARRPVGVAREREGKGRLVTYVKVQVYRNSN